MGARDGGLRERLRERDGGGQWGTVGDGGGRWGRVGDSGEEGWERERVRSAREAKCWRELELRFGGKENKPARLSTTTFTGLWSWKVPYSRPTVANVGRE